MQLLTNGRSYEKAVATFEPYTDVKEPDESTREALREIAEHALRTQKPAFLLVNNRLEGNAPSTIEAVVEQIKCIGVWPEPAFPE